ncbi:MAG: DUF3472 domain-containing protein [Bacteroidaceae bacterium]
MKKILLLSFLITFISVKAQQQTTTVPLYNNTYINGPRNNSKTNINKEGLTFNENTDKSATTYVYFTGDQRPRISLVAKGRGTVLVSVYGKEKKIAINSNDYKAYKLIDLKPVKDGYVSFTYKLISQSENISIKSLSVSDKKKPIFLSEDFNNHFGLRGPSCHLAYDIDYRQDEIEWAVIDVCVPAEYDKIGSYYMALGFSGGYFGFQNNSPTHRQVLFSVWNSVDDDNPDNVGEQHRTKVIAHGQGVTAQDFGHEGSGKQTFISVDWQPGKTYKFLRNAQKSSPTTTDYSAWFYDSVNDNWIFMATLRRPDTKTRIVGLHSFLENFSPRQGDKTRKAYYFNAWYKPVGKDWQYISKAKLTNDLTGSKGIRLDFNGGTETDKFFLTNGGYFDRPLEIERNLKLNSQIAQKPNLDLNKFIDIKNTK